MKSDGAVDKSGADLDSLMGVGVVVGVQNKKGTIYE